ncbi:hypothetical protein [Gracilibacillus massiliensis]|uniref:hypothetical protein n=1 Tax=Gracilibacillus massiliensis TaxID=1564956 RepID=UPI00071D4190|nr:hypothetical protein [Gracilibacillus massiliensis]
MKDKIIEIELRRQESRLLTITQKFNNSNSQFKVENELPPKNICGLYWIYTSYTDEDLLQSIHSDKIGAVNISKLARRRMNLNNVCRIKKDGFRIVYNGIASNSKKSNYDLRERIYQEFRNNGITGSLKISGTNLDDLSKWRYSYIDLNEHEYVEDAIALEVGWRLEYGWPILSTN